MSKVMMSLPCLGLNSETLIAQIQSVEKLLRKLRKRRKQSIQQVREEPLQVEVDDVNCYPEYEVTLVGDVKVDNVKIMSNSNEGQNPCNVSLGVDTCVEKVENEEHSSINVNFSFCEYEEEAQVVDYTLPPIFDDEEGDNSNCSLHFDETLPPIFDKEPYFSSEDSCYETMSISFVEVSYYPFTLHVDYICDNPRMITYESSGDDLYNSMVDYGDSFDDCLIVNLTYCNLMLGLNYHFIDVTLGYIRMTCPFLFLLMVLILCS